MNEQKYPYSFKLIHMKDSKAKGIIGLAVEVLTDQTQSENEIEVDIERDKIVDLEPDCRSCSTSEQIKIKVLPASVLARLPYFLVEMLKYGGGFYIFMKIIGYLLDHPASVLPGVLDLPAMIFSFFFMIFFLVKSLQTVKILFPSHFIHIHSVLRGFNHEIRDGKFVLNQVRPMSQPQTATNTGTMATMQTTETTSNIPHVNKFCTKCGTEATSKFCTNCGHKNWE